MSVAVSRDQEFLDAMARIATDVAAPNADDVDRQARFPIETVTALREEQALSAFVPTELGGAGVSFEAIAAACFQLGRSCGASAMVLILIFRAPHRTTPLRPGRLPRRRLVHELSKPTQHIRIRSRQHPVPQVEDVPLSRPPPPDDILGPRLDRVPRRQ